MNRLTLCMIVRNEAAMLRDCLDSVRGAVDAMVVVDTGSTDATVAIAEAAGATVVHHTWNNDFAAARNAALEHVKDGFVLLLDADERIAPGRAKALRKQVRRGRFDCARLPLYNANRIDASAGEVLDGSARDSEPMLLPRVFRRTADLAWAGRVHEHVTAWAQAKPRVMANIEVPIIHFGAIPELRARLGKNQRNRSLLEEVCREEPDNVVYRTYLAQEHLVAGQAELSRAAAEEAWQSLLAQEAAGEPTPEIATLATIRAYWALRRDELELAGETLAHARAAGSAHPNFGLLECLLAERTLLVGSDFEAGAELARSALEAGRESLSMANQVFTSYVLPGATSWVTRTHMGTLHLLLNEPSEALIQFDSVLAEPLERVETAVRVEAQLGRAEALILTGHADTMLAMGEELIATGASDAWVLVAVATLQHGSEDDLAAMLESAQRAMAASPLIAPHRRWFLEELWSQLPTPSAT